MGAVAIIPARGGSKGVPRKNLQPVGGVSLLARAIHAATASGVIDRVIVSTDDTEIAEAARAAGAEVPFLRPAELASDTATSVDAIRHTVLELIKQGQAVDSLILLEPTSPFRTAEHVRAAVVRFRQGDVRSVITVCPLERKPENIFRKHDDHLSRYIQVPAAHFERRQDMDMLCRLNSAVYVVSGADFLASGAFVIEPAGYVEMTELASVNIDTPDQLEFANLLASRYKL